MKKAAERLTISIAALFMLMFLCGTKACQEDYFLANQAAVPTGTSTASATPTDDEGDGETGTATPTGSATATPTEDPDDDEEDEEDPTPTPTPGAVGAAGEILDDLALLSQDDDEDNKKSANSKSAAGGGEGLKAENWLGRGFAKDSAPSSVEDTDHDGFADWLEEEVETNPKDPRSIPISAVRTSLRGRFQAVDRDMDGLTDAKEKDSKTEVNFPDTDEDGVLDGIEVLAGTDPTNSKSKAADSDRDGVSDDLEAHLGTNSASEDSDQDGLNDDMEIVLGTSSFSPDSDSDGIFDGREHDFGSDPLISERE